MKEFNSLIVFEPKDESTVFIVVLKSPVMITKSLLRRGYHRLSLLHAAAIMRARK